MPLEPNQIEALAIAALTLVGIVVTVLAARRSRRRRDDARRPFGSTKRKH